MNTNQILIAFSVSQEDKVYTFLCQVLNPSHNDSQRKRLRDPTYDVYNTRINLISPLFPIIEEERPYVMEKLMGIVNKMDETEREARKIGFPNR